ncbi:MAG: hypothetical protein CL946_06295 [Ectothiorhodospiraceae bacterium]|nr:hypothetical protein [Ectothiorhodospiraceae bacterium]
MNALDKLRKYYDDHRRDDEYEPNYVIPPFVTDDLSEARDVMRAIKNGLYLTETIIARRVADRGLLVGSSSWVFMGRKRGEILPVAPGVVACGRRINDEIRDFYKQLGIDRSGPDELWCLYGLDDDGFLLMDRGVGSRDDIEQVAADPERYGIIQVGK